MSRGFVPLPVFPLFLFLVLTATATTRGLKAGHDDLIPCSGGSITGGSIIDEILCDPDGLVPPVESHNICQLLTKCGEKAGHVRLVMYLAATFTAQDASIVRSSNSDSTSFSSVASTSDNVTTEEGGGVDDRSSIDLLKELVVASYKLNGSSSTPNTSKADNNTSTSSSTPNTSKADNNTSTSSSSSSAAALSSPSSILLVVAIKDPFQVATWHSAALNGALRRGAVEAAERRARAASGQQHFPTAVVHVVLELCKSARPRRSRTPRHIALTVVWIAFVAAFFALLLFIVVAFLRAHHRAGRTRRVEDGREEAGRKGLSRPFTVTSTSEIQDLAAVYDKSSGKVLLATSDITAVPLQDCSSTDNLLQG